MVQRAVGMGGITSIPARFVKNWNVENRALRAIDRLDRPAPPRYPMDKKVLAERVRNQTSEEAKTPVPGLEKEKDPKLNNWLKQVKVHSQDVPLHQQPLERDPRRSTSERALPQERMAQAEAEFGYYEPERVLPGKLSLRQAMEIMSLYQEDGTANPPARLAERYNCREDDINALLRHFRVFSLHIPQTKKSPEKHMSYSKVIAGASSSTEWKEHEHTVLRQGRRALERLLAEDAKREQQDREANEPLTEGERRYKEIEVEQNRTSTRKRSRIFPSFDGFEEENKALDGENKVSDDEKKAT